MKILNIMLSRDLGGIQQAFLDYNSALKLQNIEVINVTSFKAKINLLLADVHFKLLNLMPVDFLSILLLKYIIFKTKPNIIIAHGNRAINFSKYAKPRSIKLVGIAHNYSLKGLKKCDYVIALTNHMKNYLLKNSFLNSQIFILPNMINIQKIFKAKSFFSSLNITIGTLARFVPKKGIDIFINAIKILRDNGYKIKAIIGGDGEEKENLLSLTKTFNLDHDIEFIGWVKNKEEFFSDIDIFCLPSLHEPFGIILLEAMEECTPIVSTNTEGPSEIISHMQHGLICQTNSAKDLAEKITYFIENPQFAKEVSIKAYLRLKDTYDIKIVSKKLYKFLNFIIM